MEVQSTGCNRGLNRFPCYFYSMSHFSPGLLQLQESRRGKKENANTKKCMGIVHRRKEKRKKTPHILISHVLFCGTGCLCVSTCGNCPPNSGFKTISANYFLHNS